MKTMEKMPGNKPKKQNIESMAKSALVGAAIFGGVAATEPAQAEQLSKAPEKHHVQIEKFNLEREADAFLGFIHRVPNPHNSVILGSVVDHHLNTFMAAASQHRSFFSSKDIRGSAELDTPSVTKPIRDTLLRKVDKELEKRDGNDAILTSLHNRLIFLASFDEHGKASLPQETMPETPTPDHADHTNQHESGRAGRGASSHTSDF